MGRGDKESKTQFTHVASLGPKNIVRIFAGGSHSWVVLDDMVPIRENYKIPSPFKSKSASNTPMRRTSNTPMRRTQTIPYENND